ncbi:hypothetical protein JY404_00285 [Stenotrophomonas maltophilia]|uniref:hypothetical protein n=1 Tax=Stenotrophomonas pavanii TaxID=487698 RepID=UPI002ACD9685|nr:hypothetical protein [Stenotrophomonas pavanii]MBN4972878.1 hypothetical protein [Stenotrophomonas maltophilia]MDZ7477011.1 hypothetical protein [Stenotrophomonas pavanii]
MNAPCKIAAIRHAVSSLHGAADDGADTRRYADALQEAGAAIDALVAADEDYDQARDRWLNSPSDHESFEAAREAWARRAVALARVKGGAA